MKRKWRLVVLVSVGLAAAGAAAAYLFTESEHTFEFDNVNLRLRECSRSRSSLLGIVVSERCSTPEEHPTAARLRKLGVLAPVREADARWVLIKGFKSSVRGWKGSGRDYLFALGETTFGTPVPFPATEDLTLNVWVRWAVNDPAASKHFWAEFQALASGDRPSGGKAAYFLRAARDYLEERNLEVVGVEVEAYARRAAEDY